VEVFSVVTGRCPNNIPWGVFSSYQKAMQVLVKLAAQGYNEIAIGKWDVDVMGEWQGTRKLWKRVVHLKDGYLGNAWEFQGDKVTDDSWTVFKSNQGVDIAVCISRVSQEHADEIARRAYELWSQARL